MMKKILLLFTFFTCLIIIAQTPVTLVPNPTNTQINSSLAGPNITISGGTVNFGKRSQIATFTGGLSANLKMPKGVYFSTGSAVNDLTKKNTYGATSILPAAGVTYNDADLMGVDPQARYDVISYEFNITLASNVTGVNIAYQFGSEEYPNYIGSLYNDAFGFFISGPGIVGKQNLAKLSNGKGTSVNTINPGIRGNNASFYPSPLYDGTQSANYINNGHGTQTYVSGGITYYDENPEPQPGPSTVYVEHNGLTQMINYSIKNLQPGQTYTFKIILADSSDGQLDSGVFIKDISAFTEIFAVDDYFSVDAQETKTPSIFLNDNIYGTSPTAATASISSSNLPSGFILNADGTISFPAGAVGTFNFTYTLCEKANPIYCKNANVTIVIKPLSICYKTPGIGGVTLDSKHGITSLGRAGAQQDNWPMIRKGAYTVLESKTKGFVINRLTTFQKNGLTPALGMAVYDTDLDCLSIYTGSAWKCYNKQTCTDPL